MEVWREIPGYEGYYEASNLGRIRSKERDAKGRWGHNHRLSHILKQNNVHNGYMQVKFSIDGNKSQPLVHRLVAMAFLPNPNNLPQINHKDGNPSNNHVDNLEWCTASENALHRCHVLKHHNGGVKRKVICIEKDEVYECAEQAASVLGIGKANIYRVCEGKGKTAAGLHFKYAG